MEFNVGDEVKVKHNFTDYRIKNNPGYNQNMLNMRGQTYTIKNMHKSIAGLTLYRLEGDSYEWNWIAEWLEPIKQFKEFNEDEFMSLME